MVSERFCTKVLHYAFVHVSQIAGLHVYMLSASLALYLWSGNGNYPATYTSSNTNTKACKRSAERIRHQESNGTPEALQVHRHVQSGVDIEFFLTVSNGSFSVHPRQRHATFRLPCIHDGQCYMSALYSAWALRGQAVSAVLCRGEVDAVDVRSPLNAVLHIVLKLPWISLHFLRCLLV